MRNLFVLSCLVLLLGGCSPTSFVGRQAEDFTAYYNKFYNAQRIFDEEMRKLDDQTQPVDRTQYLSVFPGADRLRGSQQQLASTVSKSADVLRKHPHSRWVDDALLLIGKSYFYQQNFVAAEQKFREVVELGSGLEDEARFWLARALMANDDYAGAMDHIEVSLLQDEAPDEYWARRMRLVLGELFVERGEWERAAAELETGLEGLGDNDLAARALIVLGQVYETLERYEEAVTAYRAAERQRPAFELSYAAKVSAVRVEGRYGDAERALDQLRRMERDDKYYDNRAQLAYLRGRIYQRQGYANDAYNVFYDLLYYSDASLGDVRGATHYALGELYRDAFRDYLGAAAHFDTAATALRSGRRDEAADGADRLTPAAIEGADELAEVFASFADVKGRIDEADSLLALGQLGKEEFDDFVMELRRAKAEELAAERARQERERNRSRFQQAGGQAARTRSTETETVTTEDLTEAGFLFHRNAQRVREGQLQFVERWGPRPHVPNWRRTEAVSQATADDDGGEVDRRLEEIAAEEDVLPQVDVSAVPRDSSSQVVMRASRAVARYELGNVLFIQMNRPDSAAAWYRRVVEEDADQPVAQRALYALAEVQRALGDTASADRLYRDVLNRYPDSELAGRVRERLGVELPETVASDTMALAEEAYVSAFDRWQQGDLEEALPAMVDIAARFSQTPVAPRALLAAGSISLEWARRDTLDVDGRVPSVLTDSLLQRAGLVAAPEPQAPDVAPTDSVETAPRDSTQLTADTTQVLAADTVHSFASDTTEALDADTSQAPSADLALGADSVDVRADSLDGGAVGSAAEASPAAEEASRPEPTVSVFYAAIDERYPDAPQADRARRMIEILRERVEQRRAEQAAADSLQRAIADSMASSIDSVATPGSDSTVADTSAASPPGVAPADTTQARTAGGDTTATTPQAISPADTTATSPQSTAPSDTTRAGAAVDTSGMAPEPDQPQSYPADSTGGAGPSEYRVEPVRPDTSRSTETDTSATLEI